MKTITLTEADFGTQPSPWSLYEDLAVDAAMQSLVGVELTDAERDRVLNAAAVAARTMLRLAQVPNDWIAFIATVSRDRSTVVRSEITDILYKELPPATAAITAAQRDAIRGVRDCMPPAKWPKLEHAIFELDTAFGAASCEVADQAFALGVRFATNPAELIFCGEDTDS